MTRRNSPRFGGRAAKRPIATVRPEEALCRRSPSMERKGSPRVFFQRNRHEVKSRFRQKPEPENQAFLALLSTRGTARLQQIQTQQVRSRVWQALKVYEAGSIHP